MATTWPTVHARITSLVVDLGYTLSAEPFSFDVQPDGRLDAVCRVESELDHVEGYLGGGQEEYWDATIWIAAKHRTQPQAVYRAALVAVDSITSGLASDETAGEYHVGEDVQADVQQPAGDVGYLVGRITMPITIERTR